MAGRLNSTRGTRGEDDLESVTSFASGPTLTKPATRYAWSGDSQVDHDSYHRMLEQYRAAKDKQSSDELKIKQLAAQLARTEEAAKRALARSDQGAKGSTVQQLLDAQRQVQQLQTENSELLNKFAREKKRAFDFRSAAEGNRRKLDAALKEQRLLVRKLGEAERSLGGGTAARTAARKAAAEQEYWSEEAGRRFAVQQEELLNLREQTQHLQQQLTTAVPAETVARYESTIKELQQLVRFYEQRLVNSAAGACSNEVNGVSAQAAGSPDGSGGCGSWHLEPVTEGGACYLWDRCSGRVFTDAPEGQWPRPVGIKSASSSSVQLGCQRRLEGVLKTLAEAFGCGHSMSPASSRPANSSSSSSRPVDALQQLITGGTCVSGSCSSLSSGLVDSRDLLALLTLLVPMAAHKHLAEVVAWLALPQPSPGATSHGLLLSDVEAAVRELITAGGAVRQGRNTAVKEELLRVRRVLRRECAVFSAAFKEADGQGVGLSSTQIVALLQKAQFLPDLSPSEARYMYMLLHEWDVCSSSRHTSQDIYAALQFLRLIRAAPSDLMAITCGDADVPGSRLSTGGITTSSPAGAMHDSSAADKAKAGVTRHRAETGIGRNLRAANTVSDVSGCRSSASGAPLREAYLTECISALEAEVTQLKAGQGSVGNQQVDTLKAEVARYQARLVELENDFLSLDVVANTDVGDYDAEMRKAWFTAAAFKKRYVEHKMELDSIKAIAEKMQAALDDTHRALHAEAARHRVLEEAAAVARMEAARAKELASAVAAERAERLKLEKDYLELQGKAFAAPGGALAEVRTLREELLAARRERAAGEAREAELRREVAAIKRQFEGVSPEEHRRMARELAEAHRKCVSCELELRATLDKVEVYRRTEAAVHATDQPGRVAHDGAVVSAVGLVKGFADDEDKDEQALRTELCHLRQVVAQDAEELDKLHKLLTTEAAITLEAKAALEEAQSALQAATAEAAQQVAKLRREVDTGNERIRKLESQLRHAYSGLTRAAMRASTAAAAAERGSCSVRVSRIGVAVDVLKGADSQDALQGLGQHENMIELVVAEAALLVNEVSEAASTFLAWDFFLHDSQATPLVTGANPVYNTTVQYVVEADSFLMEYLTKQQLTFELFEAKGWDAVAVGTAHLPLTVLLQDLQVQKALGKHQAWHHVDILGSRGQQLGSLRLGLRVARPMDKLLLECSLQKQQEAVHGSDARALGASGHQQIQAACTDLEQCALAVMQSAAEQADANPSKASHLLISIHRCEGLTRLPPVLDTDVHQAMVPVQRPYVHYCPPGRSVGHDTPVGNGAAPEFQDSASWPITRSAAVKEALRQTLLQVAVFDDAVPESANALVGVADVPLASVAEDIPVEGTFNVLNHNTGQPVGTVQVSVAWHNPLVVATLQEITPRCPLLNTNGAGSQPAAAGHSDGNEPWRQQQKLQPLSAVPLLPAVVEGVPSINAAAAAAVSAALNSKKRQAIPLLAIAPATDPAVAFHPDSSGPSGRMLLSTGQHLAPVPISNIARRCESNPQMSCIDASKANFPVLQGGPCMSQSQKPDAPVSTAMPAGCTRTDQQSSSPVMRRVDPNPANWDALETTVYFKIETLSLSADALRDSALQHLLLAHMFCEDFTSAAQQCTRTMPKGPGTLMVEYAVAYEVADPVTKAPTAAGVALAQALAAADSEKSASMVLPILLASSQMPVVEDFSQVDCVATSEINLSSIWQGTVQDVFSEDHKLTPAIERMHRYPTGCVGVIRLTLVAAKAFAALKRLMP